jgi:hypothetical protein
LDQGRGVALDDEPQLVEFIAKIGRRAASKFKNRSPEP